MYSLAEGLTFLQLGQPAVNRGGHHFSNVASSFTLKRRGEGRRRRRRCVVCLRANVREPKPATRSRVSLPAMRRLLTWKHCRSALQSSPGVETKESGWERRKIKLSTAGGVLTAANTRTHTHKAQIVRHTWLESKTFLPVPYLGPTVTGGTNTSRRGRRLTTRRCVVDCTRGARERLRFLNDSVAASSKVAERHTKTPWKLRLAELLARRGPPLTNWGGTARKAGSTVSVSHGDRSALPREKNRKSTATYDRALHSRTSSTIHMRSTLHTEFAQINKNMWRVLCVLQPHCITGAHSSLNQS